MDSVATAQARLGQGEILDGDACIGRCVRRPHFARRSVAAGLTWFLDVRSMPSIAQEPPLLQPGRIAVTGFSGVTIPGEPLPPGKSVEDLTFINIDGASLKLFDVSDAGGPPRGQVLDVGRPPVRDWMARELGQVFAIAFDNLEPANIYVGATSAFGLYLVSSEPPSAPGGPDRMTTGGPSAQWMEGQFGARRWPRRNLEDRWRHRRGLAVCDPARQYRLRHRRPCL